MPARPLKLVQRILCTAVFWGILIPGSAPPYPSPPGENYIKSLASSCSSIIYNLPWLLLLLHEGGEGSASKLTLLAPQCLLKRLQQQPQPPTIAGIPVQVRLLLRLRSSSCDKGKGERSYPGKLQETWKCFWKPLKAEICDLLPDPLDILIGISVPRFGRYGQRKKGMQHFSFDNK